MGKLYVTGFSSSRICYIVGFNESTYNASIEIADVQRSLSTNFFDFMIVKIFFSWSASHYFNYAAVGAWSGRKNFS